MKARPPGPEDDADHEDALLKLGEYHAWCFEGPSMKTTYLRIKPDGKEEWVDRLDEATADYEKAALVTQDKIKALGIVTRLVEIPDKRLMKSKWVISKED